MRKIMKKSMLLVVFSFALTFWACLAFANVDNPVATGFPPYPDEGVVMDTTGDPDDDHEGDPDGYKEGWDTETESNGCMDYGDWSSHWSDFLNLWLIVSNQSPF